MTQSVSEQARIFSLAFQVTFQVCSTMCNGFLSAFILHREIRVFQGTEVHRVNEGNLAHQEKRGMWVLLALQETEAIQDHQVIKVPQVHQDPQGFQ